MQISSNLEFIREIRGSSYPRKVIAYRVAFRGNNVTETKYFSISKLGQDRALREALKFRNDTLDRRLESLPSTRSSTGVVGVSKRKSIISGIAYKAYAVSCTVDSSSGTRCITVFTYAYKGRGSNKYTTKNHNGISVVDAELHAFRCANTLNGVIKEHKREGTLVQLLSDIAEGEYPNIKKWKSVRPENLFDRED